jgi:hypothetical protein
VSASPIPLQSRVVSCGTLEIKEQVIGSEIKDSDPKKMPRNSFSGFWNGIHQ